MKTDEIPENIAQLIYARNRVFLVRKVFTDGRRGNLWKKCREMRIKAGTDA